MTSRAERRAAERPATGLPILARFSILGAPLLALLATCAPPPPDLGLETTVPLVELPRRGLSEGLGRELAADAESDRRALVELVPQVDLDRLGRSIHASSRLERRRRVVAALEDLAAASRERLATRLEDLRRRGLLSEARGLAVRNGLLIEARPEALVELARWPEVASVDRVRVGEGPVFSAATPGRAPADRLPRRSWALEAVGAETAWRRGLNGRGVVVGILDSGASARHEQLRAGFRGGDASWHDPRSRRPEPVDGAFGHGTGVLSQAIARNVAGRRLGMAPGARWVACAALPGGRYDAAYLHECADWVLRRAQPDVVINAWSIPGSGCDRTLARLVDAWRAAEILPIFAAGNDGPDPGSDRSPANYAGLYPGGAAALSVGGSLASGEVFARSSAGPNSCDGSVYPLLAAPAAELLAAMPLTPSSYVLAEGTSYAAGLVAGAAALLLEAHPEASVSELERALVEGAVDLGPPGPDPRFGYGRLDVERALDALARLRTSAATSPSAESTAAR